MAARRMSESTSVRHSRTEEESEDDVPAPLPASTVSKNHRNNRHDHNNNNNNNNLTPGTIRSAMRKTNASPRSNKVADESDSLPNSAQSSPQFTSAPASVSDIPSARGRHAGANALFDNNNQHQQGSGKKLKPSSEQKKKHSIVGASGGRSAAKEYVASRVWKNENTMTFGMRVKLSEQPEMWADSGLATTNLVDVWAHYDTNSDDILNKHEIVFLASDLVDRFMALYKEQLLKENLTAKKPLTDEQIQKLIKKDVFPHMLPGENPVESKRIMADRLFKELDIDADGIVTKTEFFFSWKNISKSYLTLKPARAGLDCVIL